MTERFDWRSELVLPPDVELVEVSALSPAIRAELAESGEEYLIHRPGARESAKAIDADGARLIEAFRRPRRVVDVIISTARATGADPVPLLEECFPFLRTMVHAGWLAVVGSPAAAPLTPSFGAGDKLGRWTIEACVRLIDDAEVLRARVGDQVAAIKRMRAEAVTPFSRSLVRREVEILRRLDGTVTPTLLDAEVDANPPWFALTWHDGVRPDRLTSAQDEVAVCLAIVDAYVAIHRQGVLHGDVHPGNILVDEAGAVRVLDFALGRVPGEATLEEVHRGAAPGYWEPEFAAAMVRGESPPPLTAAGEQYAVATLVDRLLCGEEAFRLRASASHQWHTILEGDRRCFAERGRGAWPAVERVLRRATAREPNQRFPDLATFASELRMAAVQPPAVVKPGPDPVKEFLDVAMPGGVLFKTGVTVPPRCSVNFGAAGLAFSLYRIARARDDGEVYAVAGIWQRRAEASLESPEAFHDTSEFRREDLGSLSPYHAECGVWLTHGLLARSAGDLAGLDWAIHRYLASVKGKPGGELDLTLGRSAALLGAALLYGIRPAPALRRYGDAAVAGIWEQLAGEPPVREGRAIGYLGIAHGWAGLVYASLAWARATASSPPVAALERLGQLAELNATDGTVLRTPVAVPGHSLTRGMVNSMDGWCHGQAGQVFLRLLAARIQHDHSQVELATRHGEAAFLGEEEFGNLCCGLAGRAYAMSALFRATGERRWLVRARELASRAVQGSVCDRWPNSLYKGRVGLAVLTAEIDRPEFMALPVFEDEGWL